MAASNEHRLLSKLVASKDLSVALQRGLRDEWLVDPEIKAIWAFMVDYHQKYGNGPSASAVKDNFPTFRVLRVEDSVEYLMDKTIEWVKFTRTQDGVTRVLGHLDGRDTDSVLSEMTATVAAVNAEVGATGISQLDLSNNPLERFAAYKAAGTHTMLGLPTGFDVIDEATAGLQPEQLVTIIASPKVGKSQLAMKIAGHIHESGKFPFFQSFEMSNTEQQERHDALRAHISHARLRRGGLTRDEEKRYKAMLKGLEGKPKFLLLDAVGGTTMSALASTIESVQPSVAFIDGVYLMHDEVSGEFNTPTALRNLTRSMKRMAQRLEIPVVQTTQALLWKMKGKTVSAGSIGYSSSFFEDSDVVLGLEESPDDPAVRILRVVGGRNCGTAEVSLTWDWERGCFHEEAKQCAGCL